MMALQAPPAAASVKPRPKATAKGSIQTNPPAKAGTIRLPKSITTHIELEDVDLKTFVDRAASMGITLPVPVAGQALAEGHRPLCRWARCGTSASTSSTAAPTLEGASIDGVDLGHLQASLGLEKGVLELTDFRGQLVDLPTGGVGGTPTPAALAIPAQGPLPPGGFRGQLRVEVSPPGRLAASFEGVALPLGELAAPVPAEADSADRRPDFRRPGRSRGRQPRRPQRVGRLGPRPQRAGHLPGDHPRCRLDLVQPQGRSPRSARPRRVGWEVSRWPGGFRPAWVHPMNSTPPWT